MHLNMPVIINQPNSINSEDIRRHGHGSISQGYIGVTRNSSGFPDHLRYLESTDRIVVKQKKEMLEVILGCETENRYDILNEDNQVIYVVEESSDFCMRFWCGPLRPIVVNIREPNGRPIMFLERKLACQDPCFPCCLQSMNVSSPPGKGIGWIQQKFNIRPELHVKNESGHTEFIIKGPLFQFSCKCGEVEFPIYASDGTSECGRISKRWRAVVHEPSRKVAIFGIKFPPGITPSTKALLIGATFLVDFIYFEEAHHA